ncbi:MAG TPA: ABC transporter substrate-binding protein [Burkholderiales bacterium]|nr:ABC transporter substrate-binding protein [Burkholderiales bacterium]
MHVHRVVRLALASIVMLGLSAGAAVAQEPLRIGAVNPYSGPLALYGDELARGYQIAVEERNAKGGVLGRKIELVRGDATNPQQGIAAVDQLVTREKVDVLIGTYISAVSNAASDAALRHQKLYWDTNAIAAELTERKLPNFVRSGPHGAYFAEMSVRAVGEIAKALGKQPKDVTVWLEHEDSIYGKTIVEVQKKALEKAGVKVLGVGSHNFKAADLTDVVLRAKRANPDIWVQTGYVPDGNLMLRTAREQGYKPAAMLWVGTGDTFETLDALGPEYLEGLFVVSYPRPDMSEKYAPGAAAYLATYRKTYNRDPIAPQGFAAYVGMRMLLDAVQEAGSTDPAKVRAAAAKMDKPFGSYPTGFGIKFDDSFQNTRAFPTVIQWQGGKQVTVFPVEARSEGTVLKNVPRKQ